MFKNKMFLVALFSCLISLFALVSVGYAWLATAKSNDVSFIGRVGERGYDYQFSQVINNKLVHSDAYTTEKTMPGETNIFILELSNTSEETCNIDVFFSNVHSEKMSSDGFIQDYENGYEKIQYSYSYKCDLVVNVPNDAVIKENQDETITIPTDEEINELGWEKIITSSNMSPDFTYFNALTSENKDISDYYLLKNFRLEVGKKVFIYFTVKYQAHPVIPDIYKDSFNESMFNGQFYSNQRLVIGNLIMNNVNGDFDNE